MFIKIYTIRRIFLFFFVKKKEKVFTQPKLPALRFLTNKRSHLLIYITFASENYIPKFNITWSIFTKILRKINYKVESHYLDQLLKFNKKTKGMHLGINHYSNFYIFNSIFMGFFGGWFMVNYMVWGGVGCFQSSFV